MSKAQRNDRRMVTPPVLCVVTCRHENNIAGHIDMAFAAIKGGANMIQVRDKKADTNTLVAIIKTIKGMIKSRPVKLIVNDDVQAALTSDCDGVHLGTDDMDIEGARAILGSDKIIGASAGNLDEAKKALQSGANYLGVGPVYRTASKGDAGEPIELDGLAKIVRVAKVPVIGIGGITSENAKNVMTSGANGIAVISEVANAEDKLQAVANMVRVLEIPVLSSEKLESYAKSIKN